MPKKLLLLLLLLLAGGYLFFSPKGGREELPSITLEPTLSGNGPYTVGARGELRLPGEREYNVVGEVYLLVNGAKVDRAHISTLSRGPSSLPLSLPGKEVSGGDVRVGVELTVSFEGKEYPIQVEVPVRLPPKAVLLRDLALSFYPSSLLPTGGGYDVNLTVALKNPNPFAVTVKDARIRISGNDYPLTVGQLEAGSEKKLTLPITVEGNAIRGEFSATVEWSGVKKHLKESFVLELPSFPSPSPRYRLSYTVTALRPSGVSLDVNVLLENGSSLPLLLGPLVVKAVKGDVEKKKEVAKSVTIAPYGKKSFKLSFEVLPFFFGGRLELWEGNALLASLPIHLVSSNLLLAPEVNLWVEEFNGGGVVHVRLENSNDFNVDIVGFDITVDNGDGDIANFDERDFVLEKSKELEAGNPDALLALIPNTSWITVSFRYGLKNMGLLYEETYTTLYTG